MLLFNTVKSNRRLMATREEDLRYSDERFWQNHRFVVTGGAGFLGSWLVDALRERDASDIVIPLKTKYDLRKHEDIKNLLFSLSSSGRDLSDVVIIHLAAEVGGIGANSEKPAEYFYNNLVMGTQLLHESWLAGIGKFVAVGTVCAYPQRTPVPFVEDSLWDGYPEPTNAPYGMAKKMLLVQSQAYRQQYGFNSIYLLLTNLYGPRDNFRQESSHVIPALIRKCHEANANDATFIELWGDGSPTRDFLFVKDAAEGIATATARYNDEIPVNIGSGQDISILDLSKLITQMMDFNGDLLWNQKKPNGQLRRCLDVTRAKTFGFEASTSLSAGLHETIEWFSRHKKDLL